MPLIRVDDPRDPRIVAYTGLTDEQLRRRREGPGGDLAGIFMCEGRKVTERAMAAGLAPVSVFTASDMTSRLPALPGDVPVYVGSPEVVESVTGFKFHRGFVAAFRRPPGRSGDEAQDRQAQRRAEREFNLSMQTDLRDDNRVTAGTFWGETPPATTATSVEENFARDLGWQLGDRIVFDIAGQRFEAPITSFRSIEWESFR
ncbi:MAG: hypothetical protein ACLFWM_12555, partial [Actinomycetota bacterium]